MSTKSKKKKKGAALIWSDQPPEGAGLAEALRGAGLKLSDSAARPIPKRPAGQRPGRADDLGGQLKLTVRRERAGRGGKTVTVIRGLSLPEAELELVGRALRRQLGTGASVQEGAVVLQGALVERVAIWLEARGARRVVRAP